MTLVYLRWPAAVFLLIWITACSTNWERTNEQEAQRNATLNWMYSHLRLLDEPALTRQVNQLTGQIENAVSLLPVKERIFIEPLAHLESKVFYDERPFAMSILPGQIFLSSGLVKTLNKEGLLAAAIAHEASHLVLGHHLTTSNTTGRDDSHTSAPGISYDLSQEMAADTMSLKLLRLAGLPSNYALAALRRIYREQGNSVAETIARDLKVREKKMETLLAQ